MLAAAYYGPTPVDEVRSFAEALLGEDERLGTVTPAAGLIRAALVAMAGDIELARRLVAEAAPIARELGLVSTGTAGMASGHVERLAGDRAAEAKLLARAWEAYGAIGETGFRATIGTLLAAALVELGRDDEAERVLAELDSFVAPDDFDPHVRTHWVRALILARRGELDEAERLAREAVAVVSKTDYTEVTADAFLAQARVLELAGKPDQARRGWQRALELYEQKGVAVRVQQVREHLA